MRVRKLSSGYWHASVGLNIFFQWPWHREPTLEDGFPRGWVDKNHLSAVKEAVKRFVNDAKADGS